MSTERFALNVFVTEFKQTSRALGLDLVASYTFSFFVTEPEQVALSFVRGTRVAVG
jgi:hypothetical protein